MHILLNGNNVVVLYGNQIFDFAEQIRIIGILANVKMIEKQEANSIIVKARSMG